LLLIYTEALVVTSKENGKTKYMVMSGDQNGQNHNLKVGNKSIDGVEQFTF